MLADSSDCGQLATAQRQRDAAAVPRAPLPQRGHPRPHTFLHTCAPWAPRVPSPWQPVPDGLGLGKVVGTGWLLRGPSQAALQEGTPFRGDHSIRGPSFPAPMPDPEPPSSFRRAPQGHPSGHGRPQQPGHPHPAHTHSSAFAPPPHPEHCPPGSRGAWLSCRGAVLTCPCVPCHHRAARHCSRVLNKAPASLGSAGRHCIALRGPLSWTGVGRSLRQHTLPHPPRS